MMRVKAVIADDEEVLRKHLKSQLSRVWPELEICAEAENGLEALALIEKHSPNIAFLDIRMPGLSGMEVAKKIAGRCCVVFITAYDQYAVEAFETEAVDYLLKPVIHNRLERTVKRLKAGIEGRGGPETPDLASAVNRLLERWDNRESPGYLRFIRAQQGDGIRFIPVEEVIYFKASDKYTLVITKGGESLIKKPIKELTDELDPDRFWRIHRGTIVNVSCIEKIGRSLTGRFTIRLKNLSETLTVSRTYTHLFKQM